MTLRQGNAKAVEKYREIHPDRVKASAKAGYYRNKPKRLEYMANWSKNRYETLKQEFIDLKGGKCSVCNGVFELPCYDFHHINPETKETSLHFRTTSKDKITKELAKCILICANCHRLLHYKENRAEKEKEA